jgi:hypothetical protein
MNVSFLGTGDRRYLAPAHACGTHLRGWPAAAGLHGRLKKTVASLVTAVCIGVEEALSEQTP